MSWWIEKISTTKPGRTELTTFPAAELFMPIVFVLGLVATLGHRFATVLLSVGFALSLAAKLSLIANGIYVSWGSSGMSPFFRKCYRAGYCIMWLGVVSYVVNLKLGM